MVFKFLSGLEVVVALASKWTNQQRINKIRCHMNIEAKKTTATEQQHNLGLTPCHYSVC